ncbi:hypothetical protein KAM348_37260 [Aeromonas caviae]|jgi:hypothetical protein|uniref:Uncharacterized protein n=1 Tax=Aeromonas caviae TaxID=648 RepID=A0AAI9KWB2_AERCA|nr:hypothetical protein KAM348_37260 [Aeromonas caviae]
MQMLSIQILSQPSPLAIIAFPLNALQIMLIFINELAIIIHGYLNIIIVRLYGFFNEHDFVGIAL